MYRCSYSLLTATLLLLCTLGCSKSASVETPVPAHSTFDAAAATSEPSPSLPSTTATTTEKAATTEQGQDALEALENEVEPG